MLRVPPQVGSVGTSRRNLTNRAVLYVGDESEKQPLLLGRVYIDPPERTGSDGEVAWWVVDDLVGGEVERALGALVLR